MRDVYICDYIRTPIGRYGGALAPVRADDLGALPIAKLVERGGFDPAALDEIFYGCANQAGEDNRNVARMSLLLAGLPETIPGTTMNRLCGSGMDAVVTAARAIRTEEMDFAIAGGVESMSRAPFVVAKSGTAYSRQAEMYDTTIGWRFVNPKMQARHGSESMPETGENVAADYGVSRADQDQFALRSQQKAAAAMESGRLAKEIMAVEVPRRKKDPLVVDTDEHPRPETSLEGLAKLRTPFRDGGSVTAGNASGVNDGAAALLLASESAVKAHGLKPWAKILGGATAGVPPRVMGMGPLPAAQKLMQRLGFTPADFDVIEINEAFASQSLAVLRGLELGDDDPRVNPNGGAIALGHPLGMSGARITGTAALELGLTGGKRALSAMCVGVGQGIAIALERV